MYVKIEDNMLNGMNPSPTSTIIHMGNVVSSIPPSLPKLPVLKMVCHGANPKHHAISSVNSVEIFIS